jgi:hypothetical protein
MMELSSPWMMVTLLMAACVGFLGGMAFADALASDSPRRAGDGVSPHADSHVDSDGVPPLCNIRRCWVRRARS